MARDERAAVSDITITNQLGEAFAVYDSYQATDANSNYYGTLTALSALAANGNISIPPPHPVSTLIIFDEKQKPLTRLAAGLSHYRFTISETDVQAMAQADAFVAYVGSNPDSTEAKTIHGLKAAADIDAFFKSQPSYNLVTTPTYMLALTYRAQNPAPAGAKPEDVTYSLSKLIAWLSGVPWPAGMPDITISHFFYQDNNGVLQFGGTVDVIGGVPFDPLVSGIILQLLALTGPVNVRVSFDTKIGPNLAGTQLMFYMKEIDVPVGGGNTLRIVKPTVTVTINPLFKFIVFEIKATIPFSLFGGPTFDAIAAMTIDNVEAEIGVTLDGGNHTLATPPGIKGLHFDQFGVGMGLFFEPPGYALGVQGKFHIGDGQQVVQLDDDTFAVVCELEADVPNPVYLSFYVPQLGLDQVVELFTNQSISLGFPVDFSDLSFRWAENPMEPVTLPDGTLAPMGYGFSAIMNLFGLGFYADMEIDLNNGLQGTAQLAPFSLGPVLSLTGDGTGVTIKVDANGNPIRNNTIPQTAAAKQAIEKAATKQLVQPGGAQLQVSTASSPYFKLDAKLAFLGVHDSIDATIDASGISFALDFGSIISGKMTCVLQDYHNFSGKFSYGPDLAIPLPTIGGVSLGTIQLTAQISATLGLSTSTSDVVFTAGGGFSFDGLNYQIGPFGLDINVASLSDVLSAIGNWLLNNAKTVFASLLDNAGAWAQAIYSGAIEPAAEGAAYVVSALKNSFYETVGELGDLLKGSHYALADVASAVKDTFGAAASGVADVLTTAYQAAADQVAAALQAAGYTADQIAGALRATFNYTDTAAAAVLHGLGFGASQIAGALSTGYGDSAQAVASALLNIGDSAEDAALALSQVFSLAPDAVSSALQGAGYAVSDVESAFQAIGGAFAGYAQSTWDTVAHYANPSNW
jgi:hypothetical protein